MLRNYIKIAVRNLQRNNLVSAINIFGLSISIAFCLLLTLDIIFEQSFDSFHQKKTRLFRLEMTRATGFDSEKPRKHLLSFLSQREESNNDIIFSANVGPDMLRTFPEIRSVTRLKSESNLLVKTDNRVFKEANILFADDNFFTNFTFPLIEGNSANVLSSKNNVVLSETLAKKYFGKADPIGKVISLISDSTQLFTVTGIAKEAPANSSIQLGLIFPIEGDADYKENMSTGFNHRNLQVILELNKDVNAELFEKKIQPWVKTYYTDPYNYNATIGKYDLIKQMHWYLDPLANCHYSAAGDWHYTNLTHIYELASLALVILMLAALNYILLTVSNTAARSHEVGVRKVIGANRKAIILQLWVETQTIVIFAVLLALLLANILVPVFNQVVNTKLSFAWFSIQQIGLVALVTSAILGIVAGYYPALVLSRMKPVSIIKNIGTFRINPRFSKILVVIQYTACVVLMIAAWVILRQMQYISNKDLGFDKDQILVVDNPTFDADMGRKIRSRLAVFAEGEPSILAFSALYGSLEGGGNRNGFIFNGEQRFYQQLGIDYNYFKLLGLKILYGRAFSPDMPTDTLWKMRPCVVNETFFKMLGPNAKLGVYNPIFRSTIIGVVQDYHFEDLSKKIGPESHVLSRGFANEYLFKLRSGHIREALTAIEKEWNSTTNNYPFEYNFLDQRLAKMYGPEMQWQKTIEVACLFAFLISCLGLFGLSAINAMNRTKEIGIRKVLGAGVQQLVMTLSSNFLLMILPAIILAVPVAWWLMTNWLDDFAYRIHISWWMLLLSAALSALIAFITVSFHAYKAAAANPAKSLRTE